MLVSALIVIAVLLVLEWLRRRSETGLVQAQRDLIAAQEKHIAALKEALEMSERHVLLLQFKSDIDGGAS